MDAHSLLVIYFDWTRRFVPPVLWAVHRSQALNNNSYLTDPNYQSAFDHIVAALHVGGDIGPHLSRGIMIGYESPTRLAHEAAQSTTSAMKAKKVKTKTRRDLDLMLNDWGLHHLHLSVNKEKDGWVTRTGPVLFAVFKPNQAYLIDIRPHGSWYHEDLIRIIVEEWPDAGIVGELKGISVPGMSTVQRKEHREDYRVTAIVIDGRTYVPLISLMSSGHSEQSLDTADAIFRIMKPVEQQLRTSPTRINEILVSRGLTPPQDLDIHFAFFPEGGFGIVERKTGEQFSFPLPE